MATITHKNGVELCWLFVGSGDGAAFSRNHRSSGVAVEIVRFDDGERVVLREYSAGRARTKKEAEKVARQFIREHGVRQIWAELAAAK